LDFGAGVADAFDEESDVVELEAAAEASFDAAAESPDAPDPPDSPDLPSPPAGTAASSASFAFERLLDRRSAFAQPEPLKWMVGATNALRIGAPHTGQVSGPGAWMPCTTSVRCPFVQTYS
jgi:hypothetical protein